MKQANKIDINGNIIEPVIVEDDFLDTTDTIATPAPKGLHQPLWNGVGWVEGKPSAELLQMAKDAKIAELTAKCDETILTGFSYTINAVPYHFFLTPEAQRNFQGAYQRFKDSKITVIRWTVLNNATGEWTRIDLDWLNFEPIADNYFDIVDSNIRKLRDTLEPQVMTATTIEAIGSIVW
jgi:hypothetical protein